MLKSMGVVFVHLPFCYQRTIFNMSESVVSDIVMLNVDQYLKDFCQLNLDILFILLMKF